MKEIDSKRHYFCLILEILHRPNEVFVVYDSSVVRLLVTVESVHGDVGAGYVATSRTTK